MIRNEAALLGLCEAPPCSSPQLGMLFRQQPLCFPREESCDLVPVNAC